MRISPRAQSIGGQSSQWVKVPGGRSTAHRHPPSGGSFTASLASRTKQDATTAHEHSEMAHKDTRGQKNVRLVSVRTSACRGQMPLGAEGSKTTVVESARGRTHKKSASRGTNGTFPRCSRRTLAAPTRHRGSQGVIAGRTSSRLGSWVLDRLGRS
jgi:hypothetical protein